MSFMRISNNRLAVIIPAYKSTYLKNALDSISHQTCKKFNLYIGDDNSPYNLEKIIKPFKTHLNIFYRHFDNNLGGKSLIEQWMRCIKLSNNEEWIWLFSDDDMMSPNCIEGFYKALHIKPQFDLYHFNINIIDEKNKIIKKSVFPEVLSANEFIKRKLSGHLNSYVVEYIFNRERFFNANGFENFDLAWNSDDATWIKLGINKGIKTIKEGEVFWRKSAENISPNNKDYKVISRKLAADLEYLVWLKQFLQNSHMWNIYYYRYFVCWFVSNIIKYRDCLDKKDSIAYIQHLSERLKLPVLYLFGRLLFQLKNK